MKIIAFFLFVFVGIWVSGLMTKEEKEKIVRMNAALGFSRILSMEIENFRTPVGAVLEKCLESYGFGEYFDGASPAVLPEIIYALCGNDARAGSLVSEIMEGGYSEAVAAAKALTSHISEKLSEKQKEYETQKTARAVLPVAAGIMMGILVV